MRTHHLPTDATGGLRRGFTFVELLIAMIVAAIIMGLAIPRMAPLRESAAVRSSKQVLMSYLATARQAAVRRGKPATLHVAGNEVWVTIDGLARPIEPRVDLHERNNVTLTTTLDTVRYTVRGLAAPRLAAAQVLRLSRGSSVDSLCVTVLGALGKCGL